MMWDEKGPAAWFVDSKATIETALENEQISQQEMPDLLEHMDLGYKSGIQLSSFRITGDTELRKAAMMFGFTSGWNRATSDGRGEMAEAERYKDEYEGMYRKLGGKI
jgi:hypothetical protein